MTGPNASLRIELDDPAISALEFLIVDEGQNKWFKNNGQNFYVKLPMKEKMSPNVSVPEDLVQPSTGEEAFVCLASLIPLVVDNANARFTFETLTETTAKRLHFSAYNIFMKEIHKCILHLHTHATPRGVELGEGEFKLHGEGTTVPRRVVRHIGAKSLPDLMNHRLNLSPTD